MKIENLFNHSIGLLLQFLISITLLTTIQLQAQVTQPLLREAPTSSNNKIANQFTNSKFTYKIIDAPNKTFGYDIYADGRMMIHQPSIPGMAGNEGFKTKANAIKVSQLVIAKIKKGEMPPTVTIEEMKN